MASYPPNPPWANRFMALKFATGERVQGPWTMYRTNDGQIAHFFNEATLSIVPPHQVVEAIPYVGPYVVSAVA